MIKENAKQQIKELVEKYDRVVEEKRVSKYGEENTKKDFITPLFRALSWDVENRNTPDEVTNEDRVSKGHVDYAFRLNGIPKFFLEAKALKEDLNNPKFIEQAITYAWTKGCTWAVLSDFENVMIFNAEWKTDNLLHNLLRDIPCQEFLSRFDELWLLSRESFEQGLIDKEAERLGKKAKLAPIDQYLLDDFARWRNALSKNILNYNKDKKFTEEELDETVQKLLNRLVFIRKAEDAELEEKVLLSALRGWREDDSKGLYVRLRELFRKFREIYDSELFNEALVDEIIITNDVLKEVINGLYETKDKLRRYNFAWIDADVLGNVYEQYLGHILKKTEKRADVKESRARRKEEGIYYTPTYIVDYIVRNTLGALLKDKKVDVGKIRVLDPACGSGSFLIKAFDVLNEHYSRHDKDYTQLQLDTTGQGTTFTKKVEILQTNIFGVDLDKQAVEIARLNLLLKIAEKAQRLPLLKQNIKNGNSLIDDEKVAGDKAFKWEREFKQIMDEGGFDVVIGNPPYFKIFEKDPLNKTVDYEEIKSGMMNASAVFINKSLKLLKKGGYLGMIVPKMLAFTDSWDKIRNKMLKNFRLVKVVDCGKAFKGVLLEQIIFILKNESSNLDKNLTGIGELNEHVITETARVSQKLCLDNNSIYLEPNPVAYRIKEKMEKSKINLGGISKITLGLGIQGKDFFVEDYTEGYEKVLRGDDIQRYFIRGCKFYDPNNKNIIKLKDTIDKFRTPHIVAQRIVAHIRDHIKITSAIDEEGLFSFNTVTNIFIRDERYSLEYVLALLNSKVVQYYTYKFIYNNAIRSMDFYKAYAMKIPLPVYNKDWQDKISKLARDLIGSYEKYNEIGDKRTDKKVEIEEQISKTNSEIDELVYKLYGITEEEKKIIEESLK